MGTLDRPSLRGCREDVGAPKGGMVLKWPLYGPLCCGSDFNTGRFLNVPSYGNSNVGDCATFGVFTGVGSLWDGSGDAITVSSVRSGKRYL